MSKSVQNVAGGRTASTAGLFRITWGDAEQAGRPGRGSGRPTISCPPLASGQPIAAVVGHVAAGPASPALLRAHAPLAPCACARARPGAPPRGNAFRSGVLQQLHDVAFRVQAVAAQEAAELPGPAGVQRAAEPGDERPEAVDIRRAERQLDRRPGTAGRRDRDRDGRRGRARDQRQDPGP